MESGWHFYRVSRNLENRLLSASRSVSADWQPNFPQTDLRFSWLSRNNSGKRNSPKNEAKNCVAGENWLGEINR